ncbi:hypothetical protein ACLB2K_061542 [Fragaria x ananassa]
MSSDEDERPGDPFKGFRYFKATPPARVNDDTDTDIDTENDELFILKGDADYQQMSAYQKGLEAGYRMLE